LSPPTLWVPARSTTSAIVSLATQRQWCLSRIAIANRRSELRSHFVRCGRVLGGARDARCHAGAEADQKPRERRRRQDPRAAQAALAGSPPRLAASPHAPRWRDRAHEFRRSRRPASPRERSSSWPSDSWRPRSRPAGSAKGDRHGRDDRRTLEARPLLLAEIGFVVTQASGLAARLPDHSGQRDWLGGRTDCIGRALTPAATPPSVRAPSVDASSPPGVMLCAWSGSRWPWSSSRPTNPSVRCAFGALCSALPWSAAAKERVRAGSLGPPFRGLGSTLADVAPGIPSPCLTSR
jgi:hypothetical protein